MGTFRTTDARGRAAVALDRPGRWLRRGTDLRPAPGAPTTWASEFTTLTLSVATRPET
jgi:hypothetical protein